MVVDILNFLRGSVRPSTTYLLILGQLGLAGAWAFGVGHAEQAFAGLSPFTMIVVRDYFASREKQAGAGG